LGSRKAIAGGELYAFPISKTHHSMKDITIPAKDYLRDQVEKYSSLPIYKTYRGITSLSLLAPFVVYLFVYLFIDGSESALVNIFSAGIINIPTAYFVYKGNKVALTMAIVLIIWAVKDVFVYLDKVVKVSGAISTDNLLIAGVAMVVWFLFLRTTFRAYKVEKIRLTKNK